MLDAALCAVAGLQALRQLNCGQVWQASRSVQPVLEGLSAGGAVTMEALKQVGCVLGWGPAVGRVRVGPWSSTPMIWGTLTKAAKCYCSSATHLPTPPPSSC
jgi:hypothetical protein